MSRCSGSSRAMRISLSSLPIVLSDITFFAIVTVRNWAGFDPTHKPWLMDHPHELSDK